MANEVNDFFVNVGPNIWLMKLMISLLMLGPNTEKEVPKVPNMSPEYFLKF